MTNILLHFREDNGCWGPCFLFRGAVLGWSSRGHKALRGKPDKEVRLWGEDRGLLWVNHKTQTRQVLRTQKSRGTKETARKSSCYYSLEKSDIVLWYRIHNILNCVGR